MASKQRVQQFIEECRTAIAQHKVGFGLSAQQAVDALEQVLRFATEEREMQLVQLPARPKYNPDRILRQQRRR